ncbi:hypothetical protein J6590_021102 [Homalodisca vitripennis]|nr:hypothetical protein J6590_021102 [Homalodisca vitripennis]
MYDSSQNCKLVQLQVCKSETPSQHESKESVTIGLLSCDVGTRQAVRQRDCGYYPSMRCRKTRPAHQPVMSEVFFSPDNIPDRSAGDRLSCRYLSDASGAGSLELPLFDSPIVRRLRHFSN